MYALLLAVVLSGDDFRWAVTESSPFSWSVSERSGDLQSLPSEAAVPRTDAIADSGGAETETTAPESVSLKQAIENYRSAGGQRAYVQGMTDYQHLTRDHGWSADQLRGLTFDELQYLHGASHAGKLDPKAFHAPVNASPAAAPPAAPGADKPDITIVSPETWDCEHCPGHRSQDWSAFDVTFAKSDKRAKFPCTEWTDKQGLTRQLFGKYSPRQVMWSWKATQ